jgi:ABC-2 type transport system permease protein
VNSRYRALSLAAARSYVRDKVTLFFTFAFPLLFLVTFGLIFGHQPVSGGGHVIDYIGPGVMAWAVANASLFGVAYTLIHWRNTEVLRLIRMTPTSVLTVLSSRYVVGLAVAVTQAVFFIAVAMLPVFGLHLAGSAPLAVPVLVLGTMAFFAIGLVVGTYAKSPDAVAAIANCIMLPMAFLSGTFFPIESSPAWVRGIANALPLRYLTEGMAGQLSGTAAASAILVPCLALTGFTVLFAASATKLFRWSNEA